MEEESTGQPDSLVVTNCHSVTESMSVSSSFGGGSGGEEEDQALVERIASREERRQRRMKEALERQRQPDESEGHDDGSVEKIKMAQEEEEEQRPSSWRREKMYSWRAEEKQPEVARTEEKAAPEPEEEKVILEKPRSYFGEEESTDEPNIEKQLCKRSQSREEQRKQNGGLHDDGEEEPEEQEEEEDEEEEEEEEEEATPKQYSSPERMLSRGGVRSPEALADEGRDDSDDDEAVRLEAERKLEELKRRREDAESEEFERMRQKQQESEAQLEELKRKREERRKVLEEEERQRKQEEAEKKAREEEEKRKMKEDIERRRAEAAEKRQKVEDPMDGEEKKPFKCVNPRGSSLKIGERAEFLNKSAQKSTGKASPSPVVSKIDNRLEQYTSAAQRENKESRIPRSGAVDIPPVTDSIRNIKSMWEKGSVFSSPGSSGSTFKETTVINPGVAGRINDWLNKAPESGKVSSGGRPTDLKPVDVTNKRSLWENKGSSPAKEAAGRGETKSVTNGMGY
ncbi:caldesmon 1a isoform X4 [Festucalex cinctus]